MSHTVLAIACAVASGVMTASCADAESRPPEPAPSGGIGLGNVPPGSAPEISGGLGLTGAMYGDSIGNPIDKARVKGRLPPEVIQRIVRANFGEMRKCYEEGLGRNPKLQGTVTTRFVIERDGHVSSAVDALDSSPGDLEAKLGPQPESPRFPDAKVARCVIAKFATLTFPEPQGGIVTVVYPIIFNPGD